MFPWLLANRTGGYPIPDVRRCGTNRGVPYPYPPKYNVTSIGLVVGGLLEMKVKKDDVEWGYFSKARAGWGIRHSNIGPHTYFLGKVPTCPRTARFFPWKYVYWPPIRVGMRVVERREKRTVSKLLEAWRLAASWVAGRWWESRVIVPPSGLTRPAGRVSWGSFQLLEWIRLW